MVNPAGSLWLQQTTNNPFSQYYCFAATLFSSYTSPNLGINYSSVPSISVIEQGREKRYGKTLTQVLRLCSVKVLIIL